MEKMIVHPDPERMIEGLRDTGYEFTTAVSDLIDNSISADAETISINVDMDYDGNIVAELKCGYDWTLLPGGKEDVTADGDKITIVPLKLNPRPQ